MQYNIREEKKINKQNRAIILKLCRWNSPPKLDFANRFVSKCRPKIWRLCNLHKFVTKDNLKILRVKLLERIKISW